MFDVGLTEILMIFVVALIVVGPERLPKVARTAGLWAGRLRGFVASVKADIDRELAAEELKKALSKQASIPEIEELVDEVSGQPLQSAETGGPPAESSTTKPAPDEIEEEVAHDDRRQ